MKIHNIALVLLTNIVCVALAFAGQLHAAALLFMAGSAAASTSAPGLCANTIDSQLQLTEVLDSAMQAIKRKLLPLLAFSTVFRNVQLKGDDKMAVPFYPLATSDSVTRAAAGSRIALATATATEVRTIEHFTNKVQALSFTATEKARQPIFNPVKHGELKGRKLAEDILADIFSIVQAKTFTSDTLAAVTAANFDENDVADLRTKCTTAYWPEGERALILNPSYAGNLLKQGQIIDASKRGDNGASFRDGVVNRVLGFDVYESAGVPTNNVAALTISGGVSATDVITTTAAHGFAVGDRVIFPTLTGGTGLTAATTEYFILTVPSTTTFTVSATLGGVVLDFSSTITAGTVRKYENIAGFAVMPSSILIGFAPVPPTPAIRGDLFDYQELVDESGLVVQFYHGADGNTDQEYQTIECHYGYGLGDAAQLKLITTPI